MRRILCYTFVLALTMLGEPAHGDLELKGGRCLGRRAEGKLLPLRARIRHHSFLLV
ncbi:unnamed protein product [Staurois parvus]|uniref:Uncharacterized protein n=1 Tax=Staurois parvus TaxID=386267 RepID=A0ABN9G5I1_9NEOB|nr:unnamed protein product [Staurois parvus]